MVFGATTGCVLAKLQAGLMQKPAFAFNKNAEAQKPNRTDKMRS